MSRNRPANGSEDEAAEAGRATRHSIGRTRRLCVYALGSRPKRGVSLEDNLKLQWSATIIELRVDRVATTCRNATGRVATVTQGNPSWDDA